MGSILKAYERHTFISENRRRETGRYYPSELHSCIRRLYYLYRVGEDPVPEPYVLSAMSGGELHHSRVAQALEWWAEKHGYTFKDEVPVLFVERESDGSEITISGRLDDVLTLESDDGRHTVLVEVKTLANMKNASIPKKAHIAQLNIYLKAFRNAQGILIYVDRGTGRTAQFNYEFNPQLFEETLARARKLHKALTSLELPEPEAKHVDDLQWMCRGCPFGEACANNTEVTQTAVATQHTSL